MWMLAQLENESKASEWFVLISSIMLIGAVAILILVVVGVGRRWKRRQLDAIEEDRAERRARKAEGRADAWQTSAQRYVDHDKLPPEEERFEHDRDAGPEDEDPLDEPDPYDGPGEEDRDPYGLFKDMPFQEADDEDDEDFDEDDEDFGEDEEDDDELDKQ